MGSLRRSRVKSYFVILRRPFFDRLLRRLTDSCWTELSIPDIISLKGCDPKDLGQKIAARRKTLKELGYCAVICCLVLFVDPLIGNVFTSVIIMICCVVYIKYIRFPHIYHSGAA